MLVMEGCGFGTVICHSIQQHIGHVSGSKWIIILDIFFKYHYSSCPWRHWLFEVAHSIFEVYATMKLSLNMTEISFWPCSLLYHGHRPDMVVYNIILNDVSHVATTNKCETSNLCFSFDVNSQTRSLDKSTVNKLYSLISLFKIIHKTTVFLFSFFCVFVFL